MNCPLSEQLNIAFNYIVLEVPCIAASALFEPVTEVITRLFKISRFAYLTAKGDGLVCWSRTVTIVIEAYSVLVYSTVVCSGVSCIACYRSNSRSPACECKRVLSSSCLGRSCTIVLRSSTIRHVLVFLQLCTIFVLPDNSICINCAAEDCLISLCFFDNTHSRIPMIERVCEVCISRLSRICRSYRCCTVTQIIALCFYTINHELNCINITIVFDFYYCATVSCYRCLAECQSCEAGVILSNCCGL